MDGSCVAAVDMCVAPSQLACATTQVRCPNGECAASYGLCPTHTTCQITARRCRDGRCASGCPEDNSTTTVADCPSGYVRCPQASTGATCAPKLSQCPTGLVCPPSLPVKCMDNRCAATVSDCAPAFDDYGSSQACGGNTWQFSATTCGTQVTCPGALPAKCADETCRRVPEDCPASKQCPASRPYACANGNCVVTPTECSSGTRCRPDRPIKCPMRSTGDGCVDDSSKCPTYTDPISGACPNNWARCGSGRCVSDTQDCLDLTCPPHLPFQCASGVCAASKDTCPLDNGCPADRPIKCSSDGSCQAVASSW